MSFGDGDPSIPRSATLAHAAAVARRERFYLDPETGLMVMTVLELKERGRCCGMGCRHCPYPAEEQRAAGRACTRPP